MVLRRSLDRSVRRSVKACAMKYVDLRPAIMDDDRYLKLGVLSDSGILYVVVGKILPDRSLIWDGDVGKVWCEELTTSNLDDVTGHDIQEVDNEDEKKALYSFLDQSGMLSRFAKMIAYLFVAFPSPEKQVAYTERLRKDGLTVGLDRMRQAFSSDVSYHRGLLARGMQMEGDRSELATSDADPSAYGPDRT